MAVGILYECIARWLGHASSVQARTEIYEPHGRRARRGAHLDVPDFVAIQAEFPGRVHSTIEIAAHAGGIANHALLFGSNATLRVDFDLENPRARTDGLRCISPVELRPTSDDWRVEAEFIGAIRGQEEVRLTDFATGVRYMAFTDAVNESARTGRRVAI